jgi:hypothetical protein
VIDCELNDQDSIPGMGGDFSLCQRIQTGSETHTISYPLALYFGMKKSGSGAHNSPVSSSQVKNVLDSTPSSWYGAKLSIGTSLTYYYWYSWLRHYATSPKVAGLRPDEDN